jgi:hypothetical protein
MVWMRRDRTNDFAADDMLELTFGPSGHLGSVRAGKDGVRLLLLHNISIQKLHTFGAPRSSHRVGSQHVWICYHTIAPSLLGGVHGAIRSLHQIR